MVTRYYKGVNSKSSYSRVDNIDLEETSITTTGRLNEVTPKPAQD